MSKTYYEESAAKYHYNPLTGELTHKRLGRVMRGSSDGYRATVHKGKRILGHRLAWLIHTGKMPKGQIDHINGDVTDNRWCNLRDVTASENQKNAKRSARNTSGMVGVRRAVKGRFNKWHAFITHDRKLRSLGYFHCFADAARARRAAERELGFHSNHGRAA